MREVFYGALTAAFLAFSLGGCVATKVTVSPRVEAPNLPKVPDRFYKCQELTKIPVKNMSGKELTALLAKVRQSEAGKSRCVRDFSQWYNKVRTSYGPK